MDNKNNRRLGRMVPHAMREQNFVMVPEPFLEAAIQIPRQQTPWACGFNSTARFAVMLGQPLGNYADYWQNAPYNFGFLGIPKVGLRPSALGAYLSQQPEVQHSDIGVRSDDAWETLWEAIAKGLRLGRPAVVLLAWRNVSMHYVNVVGMDAAGERVVILNTDGTLELMLTGQLRQEMYASLMFLRPLGYLGAYNAITCTLACRPNVHYFDGHFYSRVYSDAPRGAAGLAHFDCTGAPQERVSAPWFDLAYYRQRHPQYAHLSAPQLVAHYITRGMAQGERASVIFDPPYYLAHNVDLQHASQGVAQPYVWALQHYMEFGMHERRATSAEFDGQRYWAANPDAAAVLGPRDADAVLHYYRTGRAEGRPLG